MRSEFFLASMARGRFIGTRATASTLREQVEVALAQGYEVVFDFGGVEATQSFIDELIGALILRKGPDILTRLVFKSCSDDARAVIEFVATDRCDQYIKANTH
jgi:hypothetical protein